MGLFDRLFGPNIDRMEKEKDVDGLKEALKHSQTRVRRNAAAALGRLAKTDAANVETMEKRNNVGGLIKALRHYDTGVQRKAAAALGRLGNTDAVGPLIKLLDGRVYFRISPSDDEYYVQGDAAKALGEIGHKRALEALEKAVKADDISIGPGVSSLEEAARFAAERKERIDYLKEAAKEAIEKIRAKETEVEQVDVAEQDAELTESRPTPKAKPKVSHPYDLVLISGETDAETPAYQQALDKLVQDIASERDQSAGQVQVKTVWGPGLPQPDDEAGIEGYIRALQIRLGIGLLGFHVEFRQCGGYNFMIAYMMKQPLRAITKKKFSKIGLIIAVVWLLMSLLSIAEGGVTLFTGVLPGIALLVRSFRPPLDWKRGLATLLGPALIGANLDTTVLGGGSGNALGDFIGSVIVWIIGGALLWVGFKRPKVAAEPSAIEQPSDAERKQAESQPGSEAVPREAVEPAAEAKQTPPRTSSKRLRVVCTLAILAACAVVAVLGLLGWAHRQGIRDWWFFASKCKRVADTVDGCPRYRHKDTGAVFVKLEGTVFEALGPNLQGSAEYRHRQSGAVFVRLSGGTVKFAERQSSFRDGRTEGTAGPFLIAKYKLSDDAWKRVMARPLSDYLDDEGLISYGILSDFAQKAGLSGWRPTWEQRLFALGSAWRPELGEAVDGLSPDEPNEFGIVGLRHDPTLESGLRPALELTKTRLADTGAVPTGVEGIAAVPRGVIDDQEHPAPTIRTVEQAWQGLAAGSKLHLEGGEEATIRRDLAGLSLSVAVDNSSDSIFRIRPLVSLVGGDGELVATARLKGVAPETSDWQSEDEIEVPPGQTVVLEFETSFEGLVDLLAAAPLHIEFQSHGWRLRAEPLPSRELLYGVIDDQEHPAPTIRTVEQAWQGLAAGSKVHLEGGEEATIRQDLAGLSFSVAVENSSDSILRIRPPVSLVGEDGEGVAPARLKGVAPETSDWQSEDEIEVPPGQTVVLEFETRLEELVDMRAAAPLHIEFQSHGWRLRAEPLPSRELLYGNSETDS